MAQKDTDSDLATVALTLSVGTYQLVVIAHCCDSSATITSTEKVTIPSNKMTDTIYYFGDLVVTDSQQFNDLMVPHVLGMFRLVLTDDEIQLNVACL